MEKKSLEKPYVTLICNRCEFYKEDDLELECAAFKILKNFIQKGVVTEEDIQNALM